MVSKVCGMEEIQTFLMAPEKNEKILQCQEVWEKPEVRRR